MRIAWWAGLLLVTALSMALGAAMARAADYQPVPEAVAWNWSGVYLGLEAGGGTGFENVDVVDCYFCNVHHDPTGILAGGQLFGLYQVGQFVLGADVDGGWADFRDDDNVLAIVNTTTRIDNLVLAKGQLGWSFFDNRSYIYGTGGWAGADVDERASVPLIGAKWQDRQFEQGWTFGAGAKFVLSQSDQAWPGAVVLGIEWNHVDFDRTRFSNDIKFSGGKSYEPAMLEACEYCKAPKLRTDADLGFDVISASVAVKF